jgi:hypothetical protein
MVSFLVMRYLVKGRVKPGKNSALLCAIEKGTLGRGSIAGDEYLYDMKQARVDDQGAATWVETCFCDPPLAEERPYWEEYFQLLSVKDAHSRRSCRHENGTEPWACCDCDCTKKLEERLATQGNSFLNDLKRTALEAIDPIARAVLAVLVPGTEIISRRLPQPPLQPLAELRSSDPVGIFHSDFVIVEHMTGATC